MKAPKAEVPGREPAPSAVTATTTPSSTCQPNASSQPRPCLRCREPVTEPPRSRHAAAGAATTWPTRQATGAGPARPPRWPRPSRPSGRRRWTGSPRSCWWTTRRRAPRTGRRCSASGSRTAESWDSASRSASPAPTVNTVTSFAASASRTRLLARAKRCSSVGMPSVMTKSHGRKYSRPASLYSLFRAASRSRPVSSASPSGVAPCAANVVGVRSRPSWNGTATSTAPPKVITVTSVRLRASGSSAIEAQNAANPAFRCSMRSPFIEYEVSRRRAQATRGSGLSCLMGGLNAPTRSPSRRSRGELRSRGYAPTSLLPTKPPASPFPRARKGRTWLVRHFRVPSQALGRRCPPIVDRAVRPGPPTRGRRTFPDRRSCSCHSTAPGRRTPGGDGSPRWPRSSLSARPPSCSRRCTPPRPPASAACPDLAGRHRALVRAGPDALAVGACGPRDHRRRRARCGGQGRRARRRPLGPRRRGLARRPRQARPRRSAHGGRGCRRRHEPALLRHRRGTAAQIAKAGGGWGALAELVTAPRSQVRLVAHDPGGTGDGLLALGAVGEAVWLADGMDASADALSVAFPRTRVVAADVPACPTDRARSGS